jgi:phage terminase large subunit
VKEAIEKRSGDISDGINWAFNYADDRNCTHLVYDGIGIGAAVKERLRHAGASGRIGYESFIASQTPHLPDRKYENDQFNRDVFRNQRAQFWWLLRDRFYKTYLAVEKKKYTDPDLMISLSSDIKNLATLQSELVRVQRKRSNTQQIQIESKDDMRRRGIPSPNLADALVMAFAVKKIKMAGDTPYDDWSVAVNS